VKKELRKILHNLATHGIGEPGLLKGYSECKEELIDNFRIVMWERWWMGRTHYLNTSST